MQAIHVLNMLGLQVIWTKTVHVFCMHQSINPGKMPGKIPIQLWYMSTRTLKNPVVSVQAKVVCAWKCQTAPFETTWQILPWGLIHMNGSFTCMENLCIALFTWYDDHVYHSPQIHGSKAPSSHEWNTNLTSAKGYSFLPVYNGQISPTLAQPRLDVPTGAWIGLYARVSTLPRPHAGVACTVLCFLESAKIAPNLC